MAQMRVRGRAVRMGIGAVLASSMLVGSTGCETAGQGALSGGALGALAGMGLGSLSGNMGKGAAAGAIIGAITGLFVGDQNDRRSSGYSHSHSYTHTHVYYHGCR